MVQQPIARRIKLTIVAPRIKPFLNIDMPKVLAKQRNLKREHDVDRHRRQDFAVALGCAADADVFGPVVTVILTATDETSQAQRMAMIAFAIRHCQRSHRLHVSQILLARIDGRFRIRCLCFRLGHCGNFRQSFMPWVSYGRD
jgi:hypothetical protein